MQLETVSRNLAIHLPRWSYYIFIYVCIFMCIYIYIYILIFLFTYLCRERWLLLLLRLSCWPLSLPCRSLGPRLHVAPVKRLAWGVGLRAQAARTKTRGHFNSAERLTSQTVVDQKWVPKMGCPGKWNPRLKHAVPIGGLNFDQMHTVSPSLCPSLFCPAGPCLRPLDPALGRRTARCWPSWLAAPAASRASGNALRAT